MTSRTLSVLSLILLINGCSETNLPYHFAIGQKNIAPPRPNPPSLTCTTVPLNDILKTIIEGNAPADPLKFQTSFENALARQIQNCGGKGTPIPPNGASKWIAAYGLEPTDPDNDLDRLQENLRSLIVAKSIIGDVKNLTATDDSENMRIGKTSQWCGVEVVDKSVELS